MNDAWMSSWDDPAPAPAVPAASPPDSGTPRGAGRATHAVGLRQEALQLLRAGRLPTPRTLQELARGWVLEGRRLDHRLLQTCIARLTADRRGQTALRALLRGAAPSARQDHRAASDARRRSLLEQVVSRTAGLGGALRPIHVLLAGECSLLGGDALTTVARELQAMPAGRRPSFVGGELIALAWSDYPAGAARIDPGLRAWLKDLAQPLPAAAGPRAWRRAERERLLTRWSHLFAETGTETAD